MNFLFASDSFKGSLSSAQTALLLEKAAKEVFPDCHCKSLPVADGGEGTLAAVISACSGHLLSCKVHDPLGRPITAVYGAVSHNAAIIEMSAASGLTLIPEHLRNPALTTSYGTGELILDAVKHGFRDISVAIGGSATNDGGIGCLKALGIRFLDRNGQELSGTGSDLMQIAKIDAQNLYPELKQTHFQILCDVRSPLCGEHGATKVYGPQKGATPAIIAELENGMCHYRDLLKELFAVDPDLLPGAGAAGGLGCALQFFLNGTIVSGIEQVLKLISFEQYLSGIDLVITGEGRADAQSCNGKVMQGIGNFCMKKNIPVIALAGSIADGAEMLYANGITSIMTTVDAPMTTEEAIRDAENLYYKAAIRMFRMLQCGMLLTSDL